MRNMLLPSAPPKYENVHTVLGPYMKTLRSSLDAGISQYIIDHWAKYKKTPNLTKAGKTSGDVFELIVYSALVQAGVPEDNIWHIRYDSYNAEIDILVSCPNPTNGTAKAVAIHCKVSCRERWSKADRDAMIFKFDERALDKIKSEGVRSDLRREDVDHWLVTVKERADTSEEDAVTHARERIGTKCYAIPSRQCISIYDRDRMGLLLKACLNAIK